MTDPKPTLAIQRLVATTRRLGLNATVAFRGHRWVLLVLLPERDEPAVICDRDDLEHLLTELEHNNQLPEAQAA